MCPHWCGMNWGDSAAHQVSAGVSHWNGLFPGLYIKIKDKLLCPWFDFHFFNTVVPGPAASASPGNLWEMQILESYPRPTESETLGVEPSSWPLTCTLGDLRHIKVWEPWIFFFNFLFIYLFIYFWLCWVFVFCVRAFSSCGKWGPLFIAVRGPLTVVASLVAEHRLQTRRLSSCGSRA